MSKKKWLFIGGGALLLIVVVVLNLSSGGSKGTEVRAEAAEKRELVEIVSASGRIQPQTKVNITAEINGEIVALPVREGDTVTAGTLLIVLDTVRLRSDVDQARFAMNEMTARLDGLRSSLDQAEEEFNRQKQLFETKLTPENVFNNAKYAYASAKADYEAGVAQKSQMQAAYEKQLENLSKARIKAPMSGIVTFVDCEVGEIAAAQTAFTQGKTLMTIANLDVFEVEVEVDETEIGKVGMNQEARIEVDAFPDTAFIGRVNEIGNTAILTGMGTQDQSTNFKVKVVFQDTEVRIRPGMSATVDITTNKRPDVLSVPYSAVVVRSFDADSLEASRRKPAESSGVAEVHAATGPDTTLKAKSSKDRKEIKGVFVLNDGKVRFVEVSTGIADKQYVEVSSGIQPGDTVVVGPYRVLRTIKDGDQAKAMKQTGEGGGTEGER